MNPRKTLVSVVLIGIVIATTIIPSTYASRVNSQKRKSQQSSRAKSKPSAKSRATGATEARVDKNSKTRKTDNPDGRNSWFFYQRMYPFKEMPVAGRRLAFAQMGRMVSAPNQAGTSWTSIGPTPTAGAGPGGAVSGRINEIAISPTNPQIILVAGSTGGIWRSTDGGTTFVPVSDSQVDVAVGAIAFAPSNSNIVYAGMGDNDNGYFGTGVLKSTDAGATWTRINNNSLPDRVQSTSIHVDPANPNKVYLAVFNSLDPSDCIRPCDGVIGGIYVSTDGGVNWTRTLTGQASDLAIHPTNSQIVYAALRFGAANGDPRGLFKSTDGGTTWNNVFASPYTAAMDSTKDFRVAVTPAAPERVYIYFGSDGPPLEVRLEMSTDGGTTFTNRGVVATSAQGLDPGQFGYNTYLEASPVDANTVYVGSRDTFKSTDGGETFTNLNNSFRPPYNCDDCFTEQNQKMHTDQQAFAFLPGSANTWFAGNDGGIFKTTDDGATFTTLNATLSLVQFVSIALHPTDATRSYGGAQDNGSQRRVVGTSGWVEFVGGDGGKVAINPLDPSMVFPSNTEGSISRVLNNGTSAAAPIANGATFGAGTPARIDFYPPVVSNGVDARLYSGSWRLFICSDCNDPNRVLDTATPPTWTAPGGTTDLTKGGTDVLTAIAIARSANNVIYTGSRQGQAMVSTNDGVDWTAITTGLPNRSITNITVSPTDPTLVYLTVSGYGTGHIFRSTNSGAAWTDISNNLPNIPTNAFLIDPLTPTTLYAGTDIGVFRSTDNGASWTVFNDGLPPTVVMAFSAQATGRIQLSTYGRGAYELGGGGVQPTTVQFASATANVNEGAGSVTLTVNRTGDTSGVTTAAFTTSDTDTFTVGCSDTVNNAGGAFGRCDFATSIDVLTFAAGETSKTFNIPIINDSIAEGNETFGALLGVVSGATLGTPSTVTITINDNEATTGANPIFTTPFFVRQHYLDFLSREPEMGEPWSGVLNNCSDVNNNPACDRLTVSAAFFGSPEFQLKGYFVYRFYKLAFNRLPTYTEIVNDMRAVTGQTPNETFQKKAAYTNFFVTRTEFTNLYNALSNEQYVTTLMDRYNLTQITTPDPAAPDGTVKVTLTTADLTNRLNGVGGTLTRAQVLRAIADSDQVFNLEYNSAFVAMQYFGYLRRGPDTAGYNAWLAFLNANPNATRTMVDGFMNSAEYRLRFGPSN